MRLPIFPLNGAVLFPGTNLPLNIFEKRPNFGESGRTIEKFIHNFHKHWNIKLKPEISNTF